jgi:hypothetical protein
MTDAEVLIDDAVATVTLGGKPYRVAALSIRKSIAWTKVVSASLMESAGYAQRVAQAKNTDEQLAAAQEAAKQCETERVLSWLESHANVPAEALEDATAREVVAAFGVLWPIENPTGDLRKILTTKP